MYLQKTINNVYGDDANCLILDIINPQTIDENTTKFVGVLRLYKSYELFLSGIRNSDSFSFSYDITDDEIDSQQEPKAKDKISKSIINKIQESIIVDDVETNLLSGLVGDKGFQDAIFVA